MLSPFFLDRSSFRAWMQRLPGIFPCHETEDSRQADPRDPCYPNTEGPWWIAPEYLLLFDARYNVLVRVQSEEEADYRWYVPASEPGQDGEIVFAAYLRDRSEHIVGGTTMEQARVALGDTKAGRS